MTIDTYKKPLQSRSIVTEQRFLDALHELLQEKSLGQVTIEEIADKAQLTRGAFLKRFGSKKQALLILYERYCPDGHPNSPTYGHLKLPHLN